MPHEEVAAGRRLRTLQARISEASQMMLKYALVNMSEMMLDTVRVQ